MCVVHWDTELEHYRMRVPARARGSHAATLRVPDNRPPRPKVLSRAKKQTVCRVFPGCCERISGLSRVSTRQFNSNRRVEGRELHKKESYLFCVGRFLRGFEHWASTSKTACQKNRM